jgi:hypothetical protein
MATGTVKRKKEAIRLLKAENLEKCITNNIGLE